MTASELKARFDAPAEELRGALNAVCDEGERLHERVEGIIVETFGDVIHEPMLDHELQIKLNAKADEASVAERLAAEIEARETVEASLQTQVSARYEMIFGTYTGNGAALQKITLDFTPKAVLTISQSGYMGYSGSYDWIYGGLAMENQPLRHPQGKSVLEICENGFTVVFDSNTRYIYANISGQKYYYIAFK